MTQVTITLTGPQGIGDINVVVTSTAVSQQSGAYYRLQFDIRGATPEDAAKLCQIAEKGKDAVNAFLNADAKQAPLNQSNLNYIAGALNTDNATLGMPIDAQTDAPETSAAIESKAQQIFTDALAGCKNSLLNGVTDGNFVYSQLGDTSSFIFTSGSGLLSYASYASGTSGENTQVAYNSTNGAITVTTSQNATDVGDTSFLLTASSGGAITSNPGAGIVVAGTDTSGLGYQFRFGLGGTFTLQTTQTSSAGLQNTNSITGDIGEIAGISFQSGLVIQTKFGGQLNISDSTGLATIGTGSNQTPVGAGSILIGSSSIDIGTSVGLLGTAYQYNPTTGLFIGTSPAYLGSSLGSDFSSAGAQAGSLLNSLNSSIALDTPTGSINNSLLSVSLNPLNQAIQSLLGSGGDGTPFSLANAIVVTGGLTIISAGQGLTDIASQSSSEIAAAGDRVFNQDLMTGFSDQPGALSLLNTEPGSITLPTATNVPISYAVPGAITTNGTPLDTDPLLLDLTGGGINVSDWIQSPVYFDTNVVPDASGNPTTTPDGLGSVPK
jgi:hypothetical protein